jgi:predicted HNH restriction endonuclease
MDRHRIADQLRRIANAIEANDATVVQNTETLVIFGTTPNGPWGWHTRRTYAEAIDHARIVSDLHRWETQGGDRDDWKTVTEILREQWERRRGYEREREAKEAQHIVDHPWLCESCDRRFKTERGAVQHERRCWLNPAAAIYQPGGGWVPVFNDAGRIVGRKRAPIRGV